MISSRRRLALVTPLIAFTFASVLSAGTMAPDAPLPILVLKGHTRDLANAAFSPDGKKVVTASSDGTARIWDSATGAVLATLSGHEEAVRSAAFSPDGARVVTASRDGSARIWDATTGAE